MRYERRQRNAVYRPPGGPLALLGCGALLVALLAAADARAQEPDGAALFASAGCATCHGEAGVGRGSRAPRLAGSGFATSARNVAGRVLDGSGAMPSFARLANEEIAAIANYVATVINGGTALVAAADVEAMRP